MRTPELVEGSAHAPFVLLEDFWQAYDLFAHKIVGADDMLRLRVVEPMRAALARCVPALQTVRSDDIRGLVGRLDHGRQFVITMDGGTFFRRADFSIEITRATYRIDLASSGSFFRLARAGRPLLNQQGIQAQTRYRETGDKRPIVLCDDGIGTGRSIREILQIMNDLEMEVQRIFVLINPSDVTAVAGVPVTTLIDTPPDVLWLSERDLYWGLPRSGISLAPADLCDTTWGVPYTADVELVRARLGLHGQSASAFRTACLEVNRAFWTLLEQHHNRPLLVDECPRLAFFSERLGLSGVRVVDLLADIAPDNFRLDELATATAPAH